MKKIILASLVAMSIVVSSVSAEGLKIGLGLSAGQSSLQEAPTIKVPLDFDFGLRVEPELGITDEYQTLGVGAYYNVMQKKEVDIYAGGRLGYTIDSNANGITLQALVGAEHYLVENELSVALQVGLEVMSGDRYKGTNTPGFGTTGSVVLRYFLF